MSGLVITCPDCQTSYNADANSIGESGRNVRCARCGVAWFASPPDIIDRLITDPDALAHADNVASNQPVEPVLQPPVVVPPEPVPVSDSVPQVVPAYAPPPEPDFDPEPEPNFAPDPEPSFAPDLAPDLPREPARETRGQKPVSLQPPAVGADVMMRDMADNEKLARRQRTIKLIWAVPIIIVLLAAIAAWFNRQNIVNRIPQMASVYQLLGANVRAGGLEIDPPDARTVIVDGSAVVRIESAVTNLTRESKTVPLIELTLHDDSGQGLAQWYVEIGSEKIAGGDRVVFTSEYADPPAGAVGLRYRFVGTPS